MQLNQATSRHHVTNDGISLHFLDWPARSSNPHAPCCVFLHGFTNDAHIWDHVASHLSATHRVIAIDFRGHGDSAWDPAANYSHEQLVEDIHALISQLSLSSFHLIGHSLGARVAMLYAQQYQPALNSFTIIDTGPEVRTAGVNKVRKDAERMPRQFASVEDYHQFLSHIYVFAHPERLRHLAQYGLRQDQHGWQVKTDAAFTRALWHPRPKPSLQLSEHINNNAKVQEPQPDKGSINDSDNGLDDSLNNGLIAPMNAQLWQALGSIHCPTLVLRGQLSAILSQPVAQKMVDQALPNGQLRSISKAGHALMVDNPEEFEEQLTAFIRANTR